MATLYIHFDESGNLDFNRGTRFYVFTLTWTYEPPELANQLLDLRFSLLKEGYDVESFHAADDPRPRRQKVLEILIQNSNWFFASLVIDKSTIYEHLKENKIFYPLFASSLLKFVLKINMSNKITKIMIFKDRSPIKMLRKYIDKAIKRTITSQMRGVPYHIYHHSSVSNVWLQVTDYCSWSVFRKWEHGDSYYYERIKERLYREELCLFSSKLAH